MEDFAPPMGFLCSFSSPRMYSAGWDLVTSACTSITFLAGSLYSPVWSSTSPSTVYSSTPAVAQTSKRLIADVHPTEPHSDPPLPLQLQTPNLKRLTPDEISSGNSSSSLDSSRAGSSTGFPPTVHGPAVSGQIQTAAEKAQEEAGHQKQVARGGEGVSIHVEELAKMLLVFNGFVDAHVYGINERTAMGLGAENLTGCSGGR
ncbi:uncharacterized protein DFL_001731 [Arthrobotrys flagrans]|uniref:Uncharacterized protein n=1 Tax=Arthrobotrys flagrans TaxID=97331 RepID=A0A437A8L9_ARTFL|nr:hypothetical protein DFL_001731 [Arthrobotrys flagrans]